MNNKTYWQSAPEISKKDRLIEDNYLGWGLLSIFFTGCLVSAFIIDLKVIERVLSISGSFVMLFISSLMTYRNSRTLR